MTVYKPIKQEAEATAKLAAALAKGDTAAADALATDTEKDPTGNRDVKSVLLEPQLITKDNVKSRHRRRRGQGVRGLRRPTCRPPAPQLGIS